MTAQLTLPIKTTEFERTACQIHISQIASHKLF